MCIRDRSGTILVELKGMIAWIRVQETLAWCSGKLLTDTSRWTVWAVPRRVRGVHARLNWELLHHLLLKLRQSGNWRRRIHQTYCWSGGGRGGRRRSGINAFEIFLYVRKKTNKPRYVVTIIICTVSDLMLLAGRREGHPSGVMVWLSVWGEV